MKKVLISLLLVLSMTVLALGLASAGGSMTSPKALAFDTVESFELSSSDPNAYYSVTMTTSGKLTLRMASQATHSCFTLYAEDGTKLWTKAYDWNQEAGQANQIAAWDLTSGKYIIAATPDSTLDPTTGNVQAKGTYQIKATFVTAGETYTETSGGSNNSFAKASEVKLTVNTEQEIKGQIALNDEIDFYHFTHAGTDLTIKVSSKASKQEFILYNSVGTAVWTKDLDATDNVITLTDVETEFTTGDYYFSIGYVSGNKDASQGNYTLTILSHTHNFYTTSGSENWVVTTKATPDADGVESWKCIGCDLVKKTRTLDKPYSITLSPDTFVYTGKVQQPSVVVKETKSTVMDTSAYTVTRYGGQKKIGIYRVRVTFNSTKYTGHKDLYYTITPLSTKISKISVGKTTATVYWKKLSSNCKGYQIEYSTSKKFKTNNHFVLVSGRTKTSVKITKLARHTKYYFRIASYKTVDGVKIFSPWSAVKTITTK